MPGSDLCSVMLGQGGTIWRMADAFPPDAEGWQKVAVDPSVVAARVAGISYGFLLFDDTGSEWTRDGEKFTLHHMPNRFVHSRESGPANAPYLTVYLGAEDKAPPAAPTEPARRGGRPAGRRGVAVVGHAGGRGAGRDGRLLRDRRRQRGAALSHSAGRQAGRRVRMHLRDLGLKPGAEVEVAVRAVDGAGNVGPAAEATVKVSDRNGRRVAGQGADAVHGRRAAAAAGRGRGRDHRRTGQGAAGHRRDDPEAGRTAISPANHLWSAKTKAGPLARGPQRVRRLPGAAARRRRRACGRR